MPSIRDAKGQKDRVTLLPQNLFEPLRNHLVRVRALHENDLREGYGCVYLPFALAQKYPAAGRDWGWQYVFPSTRRSIDPRSGIERHHHAPEDSLQRALRQAVQRAGIIKPATVHTLRIRSPLICSNQVMTSARSRSFSAMQMQRRQ